MPIEPPEREKIAVLMPMSSPFMIDERAAGIAGIDRGVGLDEELVVGDADLGARQRRDDAARHRLPDAERIADGEHEIADFEIVGIADGERRQLLIVRLDLEHGEIGALVGEQKLGFEFAPVGEHDADVAAAQDHVVVGDDEALASTMTPEPSEFCTRSRGAPKTPSPPKKRRKNGSENGPWSRCATRRRA